MQARASLSSVEGTSLLDRYACKPSADESGPEIVYRVTAPVAGFLCALVMDGDGVDIDVHLLASLKDGGCLDRGDVQARADVEAGYACGSSPIPTSRAAGRKPARTPSMSASCLPRRAPASS